ncbi:AAA family ATPase [Pandoraea sp. PE-S2R-1]|uniref:AAA family ATPase n=1 Tax=Pandoraea sp. PE-S2R-1 TaxID=1986994 RepID=UPI0020161C2C|nr:AAA family ATPase [Pandoraea sp. PE-S2R-1]
MRSLNVSNLLIETSMMEIEIIDPDTFLETPAGRVWTPERSQAAWASSFAALEAAVSHRKAVLPCVLIVCGLQGAGKSHWIAHHARSYAPCVCFDAALPGARHRKPIVDVASRHGAAVHAVWIDTPLDVAKARNAQRPTDKRVPDASIESVASLFEPPTVEEGLASVIRVEWH